MEVMISIEASVTGPGIDADGINSSAREIVEDKLQKLQQRLGQAGFRLTIRIFDCIAVNRPDDNDATPSQE